jgi:nitroreductase
MMDFEEVLKSRRSIRKYKNDIVSENIINKIIDLSVNYSPSAKNLQPWRLMVVSNVVLKTKVVDCCKRNIFMCDAPYVIVAIANQMEAYGVIGDYTKSDIMDLSILMTIFTLSAKNEGLGTCWIGAYESEKLESLLNISYPWKIMGLTPLGYPDEEGVYKERKNNSKVVEYIK